MICGNWPQKFPLSSVCSNAEGVSGRALRIVRPAEPCVTASRFGVRYASHRASSHCWLAWLEPKLWLP